MINEKQIIEIFKEVIEDEFGDCLTIDFWIDDIDDVHDLLISHDTIKQMNDRQYDKFCQILNNMNVKTFKNIIDEYEHPCNDMDNCDKDFYGV